MTECCRLSDRIPDVASGASEWTSAELEHLTGCAECSAELALVQTVARLGHGPTTGLGTADPADVASLIMRRLAEAGRGERRDRRAVWVAVAAAAAVVTVLWMQGARRPLAVQPPVVAARPAATGPRTGESGLVPELDSLDAGELRAVLDAFDAPHAEGEVSGPPSLGDLSDHELERVLRAGGA